MSWEVILALLGGLAVGGLGAWRVAYRVGQGAAQTTLRLQKDALAQREVELVAREHEATQRWTEAEDIWAQALARLQCADDALARAAQRERATHDAITTAQHRVEAVQEHWRTWAQAQIAQVRAELAEAERRRRNATATAERRRRKLAHLQAQRSHPAS
jgi:hypothetical protein